MRYITLIALIIFSWQGIYGQERNNDVECEQYENIIKQIKTDKEFKKYFFVSSVRLKIEDSVLIGGLDAYLLADYYAYKLRITKDEFFKLPNDSIGKYYKQAEEKENNNFRIWKACLTNKNDCNSNVIIRFTRVDSNTVQVDLKRKYRKPRSSFGLIMIISLNDKAEIDNIIKTTWIE
jgi:hypothetical protein